MIWGGFEPTPPRPGSLDDCMARGFDTDSVKHDRVPVEVTADIRALVAGAFQSLSHRRQDDLMDDHCGERCDRCLERVCNVNGPELAVTCAAHFECVDCEQDNTCRDCAETRSAS